MYTRGEFVVALSNDLSNEIHEDIPNTGFSDGTVLCNIFYSTDCLTVQDGKLPIYINYGESKVFIPNTSSFFS